MNKQINLLLIYVLIALIMAALVTFIVPAGAESERKEDETTIIIRNIYDVSIMTIHVSNPCK